MKNILFIIAAMIAFGCASVSDQLNRIKIGMTKEEVIHVLGRPHSVSASTNVEHLVYFMDVANLGGKREYGVRLLGGRVISFGEKGDFDTTAGPKERIEITYPKEK